MSETAVMDNILEVADIRVTFPVKRAGQKLSVHAVRGVSAAIERGTTLGLVGESGSGKSTFARAILRLINAEGDIFFNGEKISELSNRDFRSERKRIQMVFQDPYSSLNPSMTVGESIQEPLRVHTKMRAAERNERVAEVLGLVGLDPSYALRYPDEFSGGQRQRVAIARAIALEPDLLICDEAVSALDVSTQNQVINLLEDLRERLGLSYLFISHDLAVVRHISDSVAVMYLGQIVEEGPATRIYDAPSHPYTQALLKAVPIPDPVKQRAAEKFVLTGDVPDPVNPPDGCAFHLRCPKVMDICGVLEPESTPVAGGGSVRCHLYSGGTAQPSSAAELPTPVYRKTGKVAE